MPCVLWMGGELVDTISASYLQISNALEPRINEKLANVQIDIVDKWIFIAIILPLDKHNGFPEVVRFSPRKRYFGTSLYIDYETFLHSDLPSRVDLVAEALIRGVDVMKRGKLSATILENIKKIIQSKSNELKATLVSKHN